ncbi:hypothetical protein ACFL0V_02410 [Nanoarchaeota archaeon]
MNSASELHDRLPRTYIVPMGNKTYCLSAVRCLDEEVSVQALTDHIVGIHTSRSQSKTFLYSRGDGVLMTLSDYSFSGQVMVRDTTGKHSDLIDTITLNLVHGPDALQEHQRLMETMNPVMVTPDEALDVYRTLCSVVDSWHDLPHPPDPAWCWPDDD